MQGSAWPGKVGRGSRQHGWGLPVPPARLGSAGRTAPGLRARSPRCQHAEIGVPVKQEALRGLRGSPAPALPTPVLREGSQCKNPPVPAAPRCQPRLRCGDTGAAPRAQRGAGCRGWSCCRVGSGEETSRCALTITSSGARARTTALVRAGSWHPMASIWAHHEHHGHREHRGHHGHRGSVPKPGLQFWAARPVLRSPGRGAAGPRPPLLCSP